MDNDQRGGLGESFFETWCKQAEMTPVRATPDRFGWDFHVTLHEILAFRGAFERRDVERQCKVQVKTTIPKNRRIPMSLSNWERMAKEQVAWFVVVVILAPDDREASDAFLIHIDKAQIAKVLKRLREHDQGSKADINDVSMDLVFDDTHKLGLPTYASLRREIVSHLGLSETDYLKTKTEWLHTVGYDEHPMRVLFEMSAPTRDAINEMWSDWSIGVLRELPVENLRMEKIRFNIATLVRELPGEQTALFSLPEPPSVGPAKLTFSNTDKTETVLLTCDTRTTSVVAPWLPQKNRKVYFVAPFFSLLASFVSVGGQEMISFKWHFGLSSDDGDLCNLEDLARACRVVLIVSKAGRAGLHLRIQHKKLGLDKTSNMSAFPEAETIERDLVQRAQIVRWAAQVAAYFDLDARSIDVEPEELWERRMPLALLVASTTRTVPLTSIEITTDADAATSGKMSATIFPCAVPFGEHVVVGICAVIGVTQPGQGSNGGLFRLVGPECRLCHQQVMERCDWDPQILDVKAEEVAHTLVRDGIQVIFMRRSRSVGALAS